MFDAYGSYDFGFLIMGIMITLSGAMLYPIPVIKRSHKHSGQLNSFQGHQIS